MNDIPELNSAATRFQQAHAITLQALLNEEKEQILQLEAKKASTEKIQKRDLAVAYNQAANFVSQQLSAINDLSKKLLSRDDKILRAAEYLSIGNANINGETFGLNSTLSFPIIVPFISQSNILISTDAKYVSEISQAFLWSALSQTAAGQLQLITYNPDLSPVMSPFSSLGKDGDMFQIVTQSETFEALLVEISKDVQSVMDMMRGTTKTLAEFRRKTKQPVGIYKVVTLLDFPKGIDERSFTTLISLCKVAPKAGISFLIVRNSSITTSQWLNMEELKQNCFFIDCQNQKLVCQNISGVKIDIPNIPITKIVEGVDELIGRMETESAPPVLFSSIESSCIKWSASSADGITFALGTSGLDTVEVRLGDERTQKHNVIISGAVGQGKSNLIKVIIHSLCSRYSPQELNLYLLDFKEGVTLFPFSNIGKPDYLPHARVLGLESDRDFGLAVLTYLEHEFDRRSRLFRQYGDSIAKYRAARPAELMPRIVLIIDEFHFLFNINDELGEQAANKLESLARKGRAYGIHLILASQSITGASALLTKEEGVFGQFPIRIALKNHLSESYATFVQGNDAATKLRIRGQAVINYEYGSIDANKYFTVAWASDDEFKRLRIDWWNKEKSNWNPPTVFNGGERLRVSDVISDLSRHRNSVVSEGHSPTAFLGRTISVEQTIIAIPMSDDAGRNIAILGAGDNVSNTGDMEIVSNNAVGIMQTLALSLALQHPSGDARFVVFDLLDKNIAKNNNQDMWLSLIERLGFTVELIEKNEIPDFLNNMAASLSDRSEHDEIIYLIAFAMDRAGNISKQDPISLASALDSFQQILREGSAHRVHFIGWWSNIASYTTHLGYGNEGYVETKIILRLDESATQSILGPFVHWSVRDNRALVSDQTQLAEATTIIPFSPIIQNDVLAVTSADWGEV